MSDSIDIMNKIWQILVDNNVKSFKYDSDTSGESVKMILDDNPEQELQIFSLVKNKDVKNE